MLLNCGIVLIVNKCYVLEGPHCRCRNYFHSSRSLGFSLLCSSIMSANCQICSFTSFSFMYILLNK